MPCQIIDDGLLTTSLLSSSKTMSPVGRHRRIGQWLPIDSGTHRKYKYTRAGTVIGWHIRRVSDAPRIIRVYYFTGEQNIFCRYTDRVWKCFSFENTFSWRNTFSELWINFAFEPRFRIVAAKYYRIGRWGCIMNGLKKYLRDASCGRWIREVEQTSSLLNLFLILWLVFSRHFMQLII